MKSWISFLLPDDEYKEKKLLYFISEGATILVLYLIGMYIMSNFYPLNVKFTLALAIGIFILYVFLRYILSGIEYTDVSTESDYRKQLRVTRIKSFGFVAIFFSLYILVIDFPHNLNGWLEIIGIVLLAGIFLFLIDFISLKRSYEKNKDLV